MSSLTRPLGRLPYLLYGVVLAALKIALDHLVAGAHGRPYSVLFYVSPIDAPLFHPSEDVRYWQTLAVVAVPFIAAGVMLTGRRLRDAGLSPWMVLLFFVPFANLLFFLVCVCAPTRAARTFKLPAQPPYRAAAEELVVPAPERSARASMWIAATFGAVLGLGAMGVSVGVLREYGAALMLGAPAITGFATGAFYGRLRPRSRFRDAAAATALSSVLMLAFTMVFALEGAACLVMMLPLLMVPSFFCAYLGYVAATLNVPARTASGMIGGAVLLFPLLLVTERVFPMPALLPPAVETAIDIDAPPERVWAEVIEVAEMEPPDELLFRVGIAYPLHATLDAGRVGAVRRCEFTTGTALETVEAWDPPNELTFHIDSQPDPMREATLWSGPRQPHLDGYVRNQRGQFTLERLPGARTRLTGRSWYTVRITPESYWRVWSDAAIHAIHRRVLRHVKVRAEALAAAPIALHPSPPCAPAEPP